MDFEKLIEKMQEMEQEDKSRCSQCSGEDCFCCEVYKSKVSWNDFYSEYGY